MPAIATYTFPEPWILAELNEYPPRTRVTAPSRAATISRPPRARHTTETMPRKNVAIDSWTAMLAFSGLNSISSLQSQFSQNSFSGGLSVPQREHFMHAPSSGPILGLRRIRHRNG